MHLRTHTKPESLGQAGRWQSPYHDTMIDYDKNVGELLSLLDELGIADNTLVMYSTDNGPHMNTWPDGAMTPFRSEKDTTWEGAFRIPLLVRWPGKAAAGTVSNEIVQHHDWLPTFLAMAGDAKVVFMEQRAPGTLRIWAEPFVALRLPKLYNLRTDPFERADITSNTYYDWFLDHDYIALASQAIATTFVETFKEFPPRQRAASFTIDQALTKMAEPMRKAA
jgi:arylsulfatase